MYLEETCVVYLNERPLLGRGLRLEDFLEETCVVYLLLRPSVGRGLRLDDVSCRNFCCLRNGKAFGGVEG